MPYLVDMQLDMVCIDGPHELFLETRLVYWLSVRSRRKTAGPADWVAKRVAGCLAR